MLLPSGAVEAIDLMGDPEEDPEGEFTGVLTEVRSSADRRSVFHTDEGRGPSGYVWWEWTFEIDRTNGRRIASQRVVTSLSPASHWKLKEMFEAFGVSAATNTDELIGRRVRLVLSTRVAEPNPRWRTVVSVSRVETDDDPSMNPNEGVK